MSEKEKLELGVYLFDIIRCYTYENYDNIDDVLNAVYNDLSYELEKLEYKELEEKLKGNY